LMVSDCEELVRGDYLKGIKVVWQISSASTKRYSHFRSDETI